MASTRHRVPGSSKATHRGVLAGIVAITLAWSAVPAMALTPVKVIGGPGEQYWPSSNGTYLAWTSWVDKKGTAYVMKLPSGTARRVNPRGTNGEAATFVGSSNVLVYAQWSSGKSWDVYFYDVLTRTRTRAPGAVNGATTVEFLPAASERYILFERIKYSSAGELRNRWLLLYDRSSKTMRTLDEGKRYYPGFAGTTYVAWTTCGSATCNAYYWSETGGKVKVSLPTGKAQYSPTIDEANSTVYFVRAVANKCGRGVTIRRSDLASSASTVLASLPSGIDAGWEASLAPNTTSGHLDFYFERWVCKAQTGDIYALRGVDTV